MSYVRLWEDEAGESHFEEMEVALSPTVFARPAAPIHVSGARPAEALVFFMVPSGWLGEYHPAPRRQFFVQLSGELEIRVSDGTKRRFSPGDVALLEDLTGKGHETRTVGRGEARGLFVQLPNH